MTKENKTKSELIEKLVRELQEEQNEDERKADRNYHIHNVSLEYLESLNVPVEQVGEQATGDLLDEMLSSSRYGLLEVVENEHLFVALKELKELDLDILSLRYKQNLLLKEISQVLEKDLSSISRRIDSSLKILKEKVKNKK